jgi:hypothetical protein
MGAVTTPTYTIENPRRIETSIDGSFVMIIADDGWTLETSPHNVVIVSPPKEKKALAEVANGI